MENHLVILDDFAFWFQLRPPEWFVPSTNATKVPPKIYPITPSTVSYYEIHWSYLRGCMIRHWIDVDGILFDTTWIGLDTTVS